MGGGRRIYITAWDSTGKRQTAKKSGNDRRTEEGVFSKSLRYNEMSHLPKGHCSSSKGLLFKSSIPTAALPLLAH